MRRTRMIIAVVFAAAALLMLGAVAPLAAQDETSEAEEGSEGAVATDVEVPGQDVMTDAMVVPPEATDAEAAPEAAPAPAAGSGATSAVQAVPATGVGSSASVLSHAGILSLFFAVLAGLSLGALVVQRRESTQR
jgi:hypothetical protein